VGLYRTDTGERLPVLAPSGAEMGDGLVLPISITHDSAREDD
jgi:hypothetical protein